MHWPAYSPITNAVGYRLGSGNTLIEYGAAAIGGELAVLAQTMGMDVLILFFAGPKMFMEIDGPNLLGGIAGRYGFKMISHNF